MKPPPGRATILADGLRVQGWFCRFSPSLCVTTAGAWAPAVVAFLGVTIEFHLWY
jgi:hypothetical protein